MQQLETELSQNPNSNWNENKINHYRCYIHNDAEASNFINGVVVPEAAGQLNLWCFSPHLSFAKLKEYNIRQMIFTSGTLAPLNSFSLELDQPFPIKLSNPHVIDKSNLFACVLTNSPSTQAFNFSYSKRSNEAIKELGNTLAILFNNIPAGILVVLPSYKFIEECQYQ
eukprot:TRINITY_DN36746_c0_g1_i1.p2 TRINITY_DN36746_c0_g1~~TRINITY_DN36746_c0_g1_i1.p2  ORF type:complete len:169 (+),score=14.74 TRINITY_DN36746_c0_g1_i1:216-722(+)